MNEKHRDLNQLSYQIIGAAIEVHKELGPGFLESVYEQALCIEFELRDIPFAKQAAVDLSYKGQVLGAGRLDLLVDNLIIVELKVVDKLAPIHSAQLMSYLKATNKELGLLINFNVPVLKSGIKRILLSS